MLSGLQQSANGPSQCFVGPYPSRTMRLVVRAILRRNRRSKHLIANGPPAPFHSRWEGALRHAS
jgi:hypothetical protein